MRTAAAAKLNITADRTTITANGNDLSFITVKVVDSEGITVPQANNALELTVSKLLAIPHALQYTRFYIRSFYFLFSAHSGAS
jgi:hypothetical protein